MKTTTLIIILLIACITASAQTKCEKRYLERLERKQHKGYSYRVNPLPGVRYKKSVKPKTVATIAVIVFLGGAVGTVVFEEFVSPKQH